MDECAFPHLDQAGVERVEIGKMETEKDAASSPDRGRSPSRGSHGSRWKKKQDASS